MLSSLSKFLYGDIDKIESLQQLREKLLDILLICSFLIGLVLFVPAFRVALENELHTTALVYVIILAWLFVIAFIRRIPYITRALSWMTFLFALGLINLILSGFNVDAGLFFLTFVAMATLLFNLRAGAIALSLSSLTIVAMSYMIVRAGFELRIGLRQTDSNLWLIGGLIFVLTSVILTASFSVLLRGLQINLRKATTLLDALSAKNQALVESEMHYRKLVETSPDAVLLVEQDGAIVEINPAGVALLGYAEAGELTGRNVTDFIAPEGRDKLANSLREPPASTLRDIETSLLRKDGSPVIVEFSTCSLESEGEGPVRFLAVGRDITGRKRLEHQVSKRTQILEENQMLLRQFTHQIIRTQEDERRHISRELHDEAGQVLVTIRHGINAVIQELPRDFDPIRKRLSGTLELVTRGIGLVRSLSQHLRPPALEVGGINICLSDFFREIREQTGIETDYRGANLPDITDEVAISLFRVAQEAVTNVIKHSGADKVVARLSRDESRISLQIVDNGNGGGELSYSRGGVGLLGMKERLNLLGGNLTVEPSEQGGYRLTATIPWSGTTADDRQSGKADR
ncbi:MAG: PAS domain S-box protein [Chloroflexota bacterium]